MEHDANHLVVLCVDDDADIRLIVDLSLRLDSEITIHLAASGEEALALWLGGLDVDVALIDAQMPGMSGIELARLFRQGDHKEPPRIIFLTAAARAQDAEALMNAGAIDVTPKPFDPITLAARLRSILT